MRFVCITYWSQDTNETGHWVNTEPMSMEAATRLLEARIYYRGEIVEQPADCNR